MTKWGIIVPTNVPFIVNMLQCLRRRAYLCVGAPRRVVSWINGTTVLSFSVNSAQVSPPALVDGIPIVALVNTAPPTTDENAPAVVGRLRP